MKFAILAFIVLAIFLTFYLTISMWIKAKNEEKKKVDPREKPTEPTLPTVKPTEEKKDN